MDETVTGEMKSVRHLAGPTLLYYTHSPSDVGNTLLIQERKLPETQVSSRWQANTALSQLTEGARRGTARPPAKGGYITSGPPSQLDRVEHAGGSHGKYIK